MPERRIQRHGTRLASVHEAALDPQFPVGTRVVTPEGLTGRVLFIDDSFSPGNTAYQVELDHSMGGGTYLGSQLRAVPAGFKGAPGYSNLPAGVHAASLDEVEAELDAHLASDDYPEMGSILHERPDPASQIRMIGALRTTAHFKRDETHDRDDPDSHNYDYCWACKEHHGPDGGDLAQEHESASSDWREHYQHLPAQIYRGMALKLPQAVHDYVHDKSVPVGQRAAALSTHLGQGGSLGTHWTITKNQARHYAEVSAHHWTGSYSKTDPSVTHVVIHADKPKLRDIERNPDILAENQVLSYDSHEDAEVPLQDRAPVRVRGLSWKRDDERDERTYPDPTSWNEHMFRPAHEHTAAAEPDYYVDPDELGYLGARDYYNTPLRERPWEHGNDPEGFQRRVDEIKETAQHEGIREPVEVMHKVLHDGTHRWEAARQLGIQLPIRRTGMQHEATEIYGVPIDEQGDAPEHGLIPRSENPDSYDHQSTEGDQDPEQSDDPWMKDKDQPSQSGNIGPDGIQGADAGGATGAGGIGGYGAGGGVATAALHGDPLIEHMIHYHAVYPDEVESEEAMQYAHAHHHRHTGIDEFRTETTLPPHTHHELLQPWEDKYPAPHPAESMPRPGNDWADYQPEHNEIATPHQHQWPSDRGRGPLSSTLSSLHEARVPWTDQERTTLHNYPVPAATWGDFVPSYDFTDPKQRHQHADMMEPDPADELEGSLGARAEAVRIHKAAGLRQEATSERQWEMHLRQKHGWSDENFRRLSEQGDRPSDMHSALHEARMANHYHSGGPDEEDAHIQAQMEEERVRNAFGPKRVAPGPNSRFRYKHHDELPHDPDQAVLQNKPFTSDDLDMWHAGTTPLSHYSSREDELYRHMRFAHGYSHAHLRQLLADEGHEGMELSHSVGHSANPRDNHTEENIHSSIPHPQAFPELTHDEEQDATNRWGPSLGKPSFVPQPPNSTQLQYLNPGRGGRTPRDQERRETGLTFSTPVHMRDPEGVWPRSYYSSLDPSPRAFLEQFIGAGRNVADEVYNQLAKDYPPEAIDWVHGVKWSGPEPIPLDQIDWENKHQWAASHEPKRVKKFEKKIQKKISKGDHAKPMIGVARPDAKNIMIADGHHRGLAYEDLDQPAWGYVAHPDMDEGPWDEMHAQQLPEDDSGDEFGDDEKHSTPMDKEGEQPAQDLQPGQDSAEVFPPGQQPQFSGPPLTQASDQGHKDHLQAMQAWETAQAGGGPSDPDDPSGTDDSDGPPVKDKKKAKEAALYPFEAAADSASFRFHFTATWHDVVAKAKRIRANGGVRITASTGGLVVGQVRGDHDVYESGIQRVPGKPRSIQHWACGCPWASWHQDKSYPGRLNGRPCSHVWALQLEATARQSSNESRGITRTDPAINVPYSEVVVKSLGPWTNGGWAQTWTAPATRYPLREAAGILKQAGLASDDIESLIIMTADQANAPWGGQSVPKEQPQPTYGGTEKPQPDMNPAQYGMLNAPDPENWGSIDDSSALQMPMHTDGSLHEAAGEDPYRGEDAEEHYRQYHGYGPKDSERLREKGINPAEYHRYLHRTHGDNFPTPHDHLGINEADRDAWRSLGIEAALDRVECSDCGGQVEGTNGPGTVGRCRGCGQEAAIMRFPGARKDKAYPIVREDPVNITGLSSDDDSFLHEHGIQAALQVTADPTDVMVAPTAISPVPRDQGQHGVSEWHENQDTFPYVDRDNTAGPSTSITPRDPDGIRFEEMRRQASPELRHHMRFEHGFQDSPDDPDWLIEQTHDEEHEDPHQDHDHPEIHEGQSPDNFSWRPAEYVSPARSKPELMQHLMDRHGVTGYKGDKEPATAFLHMLHEGMHAGDVPDKSRSDHQHDSPEGHHDPVFGALQRALAEVGEGAHSGNQVADWDRGAEHPADCVCPTCEYDRHHSQHRVADLSQEQPELLGGLGAELHDKPEGALDADGLTAGDTPMGGGDAGAGTMSPAAEDVASLGEFGAARRAAIRERLGFGQAPQYQVNPAGHFPLDPGATGGGPGMSQEDEDLTPNDLSIQTIGQQQWSGAGADSDEVAVPAGDASGSEAQIVAAFQASAAAKHFAGGGGAAAGDGDIAAQARQFLKTGMVSDAEANELIAEGKGTRARNLDLLDLEGTHYEAEAAAMDKRGLSLDDFDDDLVLI